MAPSDGEITRLPAVVRRSDAGAGSYLIELVCRDFHAIARRRMERKRDAHTLQPTALLHEANLPLLRDRGVDQQSCAHFFDAVSVVMRRILMDHARPRNAGKRPVRRHGVGIDDFMPWYARRARRVELIFFGGVTEEKAARVLSICGRAVKHDYSAARAPLQAQFGRSSA